MTYPFPYHGSPCGQTLVLSQTHYQNPPYYCVKLRALYPTGEQVHSEEKEMLSELLGVRSASAAERPKTISA